jgi:enoyl-CoA hydratase
MMEYVNVEFEVRENIGLLTVNRPKALNALNAETIRGIRSVLAEVKGNDRVKVLVITGAGEKAFIAGADIGEIQKLTLKDGLDFLSIGHQMNREIETLGVPTIAAVNGLALGGGCEVSLACSLRIVSEKAKFGLPELGLGVIPGYGGTQRLVRLIGKSRALWYLLTGDMIDAQKAVEIGLAAMVIPQGALIQETMKVAARIAEKGPLAVKMILLALKYGPEVDLESALVLESAFVNLALASEDKKEGVAAFFEKRKPLYKGQ